MASCCIGLHIRELRWQAVVLVYILQAAFGCLGVADEKAPSKGSLKNVCSNRNTG